MAAILKKAYYAYQFLFEENVDPRTKTWFLIGKPLPGIAILTIYLMFVLKWGPKWMKDRKPYNLDKLLIVYNLAQVISCCYIFHGAVWYAWGWDYKWVCEPVDYSNTEKSIRVATFVYYYFLSKVVDLLDTVFFVLRKKFNQISFLHVYHHTGMVLLTWGACTYYPGGHGTLIGVINSFVHIVMYGYYLLTVAFPVYKQSLWWKKYITQLQILQFFWCVVHMAILVFKTDCAYPRWTAAVFLPQNLFMLILFIDFYIKSYIRKPKTAIKVEVHTNGNSKINGKHQNGVTKENGIDRSVVDTNGAVKSNGNAKENELYKENGLPKENGVGKQNGYLKENYDNEVLLNEVSQINCSTENGDLSRTKDKVVRQRIKNKTKDDE